MKLSRELWLQVEPLLTVALEMDVASRTAWLDALSTSNPDVAPLLRKMLETHDRAERSKRLALLAEARSLLADAVAFIDEVRADKLGAYAESEAKELLDTLGRCDEALAKLICA